MLFASSKTGWIPLYALMLFLLVNHFGVKLTGWVVLAVSISIILSDQGSVLFFKEIFLRQRPCHLGGLTDRLNMISGHCGGKYGFISSHSANVFALSMIVIRLLSNYFRFIWLLFVWAAMVAVSRVYLGVHYPSDVLVGALYGSIIGFSVNEILTKVLRK